jgi:hypothetical protein
LMQESVTARDPHPSSPHHEAEQCNHYALTLGDSFS